MAASAKLRNMAVIARKLANHPVGRQVEAHVINEFIDSVFNYIKEKLHPQHDETLLPAGGSGHQHMLAAVTSNNPAQAAQALDASYRAYALHTGSADPYHSFYAHYWAGMAMFLHGDVELGRAHLKDAYQAGAYYLESDGPRYKDDPEWEHREDVAIILDAIGPGLGF